MQGKKILQVGLGSFGKNHLRAWHELGLGGDLYLAELDRAKWSEAQKYNLPEDRMSVDFQDFLNGVDVVDVVTPTDSHFELCKVALRHRKDVFVEKPMTMTSNEARYLVDLAQQAGLLIQVGYYYRFHPISQYVKRAIECGRLGNVRYLTGNFYGFKRARPDVGVTHTDAIHFLNLFNWLLGLFPKSVYALTRDHFGRGMEDLSIVLLTYPGEVLAKVESGYIQPGKWRDKVVPRAMTTKEIVVVGEKATIEIDYETENLIIHDVHHELKDGIWVAVVGETETPNLETYSPVQLICRELGAFLECAQTREQPAVNPVESGIILAQLMESIYESANTRSPVGFMASKD